MPTYQITAPDGAQYEVSGDGTEQEALAYIQSQHQQPMEAAPPTPQTRVQALKDGYKTQYAATQPPIDQYSKAVGNFADNVTGAVLDPLATFVTGGLGMAAGGIAGIAQGAKNLAFGDNGVSAADRTQQVAQALTYEPKTTAGKATADVGGRVLGYPLRKLAQGADVAGQAVSDVAGPVAGTVVNTAIQAAPALLLRGKGGSSRVGRAGSTVAEGEAKASVPAPKKAEPAAGLGRVSEKPPTIEDLRKQKSAAYKAAEDSGVVVSRDALNKLKVDLANTFARRKPINPKLYPKTAAAFEDIVSTKGQLPISQLDELRKIANAAKMSSDRADAFLGGRLVEKIDDFESSLSARDLVSGDAKSVSLLNEARSLNSRFRKAETVDDIFKSAKRATGANYTTAGMETALRQKFRALADNKKKMRGFNAEERAAIEQFIEGGKTENMLRKFGKFAPDGLLSGYAAVAAVMANPVLGIIPAAGGAAKYASTRLGIKNANAISELVRRGPENSLMKRRNNALMPAE